MAISYHYAQAELESLKVEPIIIIRETLLSPTNAGIA